MNRIEIDLTETIGFIRPEVHGQFIEHLGSCVYDGFWVGESVDPANIKGLRRDVVTALQRIAPPVLRWPGGCFADAYHWEDGIGPRETRPTTVTSRWRQDEIESNAFGTHEFVHLCQLVGAQPWINGNLGGGTPRDLAEWVEYCNFGGDTTMTRRRSGNGSLEPFGVRFWGLGNESWDCGGKFTPEDYARGYKRFESHFPAYQNQTPYLIACGPDGNKKHESSAWTRGFFEELARWRAPRLHGWDAHYYTWNSRAQYGTATEFTIEEWYGLLADGLGIEELILEQRAVLDEWDPERQIGLIIGEWGVWHPRSETGPLLWQQNSLRDALAAALTLDVFQRHADKVVMATLAQTVNVLHSLVLTGGNRMFVTPTYHVFDLYKTHRGGQSVRCELESETTYGLPALHGSASVQNGVLTLSVVNVDAISPVETEIQLRGGECREGTLRVLAGDTRQAHNTFDEPHRVEPTVQAIPLSGQAFLHVFPPASISVFQVELM